MLCYCKYAIVLLLLCIQHYYAWESLVITEDLLIHTVITLRFTEARLQSSYARGTPNYIGKLTCVHVITYVQYRQYICSSYAMPN